MANLQAALAEESLAAQIRVIKVQDAEEAQRRGFLGSPSIHVDGADLWPDERRGYFWGCRVYRTPEGMRGWPSVMMIREKLAGFRTSNAGGAI